MPFERFTDRARKVMQLANEQALRFNHEYIGTEHLLLGLIKEGEGTAANILKNLGIDLRQIRNEVEKIVRPGPDGALHGRLPHTPRSKKVLEHAMEESKNFNHNYVDTEHLLLGLLLEPEGVACQVLTTLGVQLESVRQEIRNLVGETIGMKNLANEIDFPDVMIDHRKIGDANASKYFQYLHALTKDDEALAEVRKRSAKMFPAVFQTLCEAAKKGDIERLTALFGNPDAYGLVYEFLIDAQDEQGKTPLFYAVRSNRDEAVQFLIEKRADVNVQDCSGKTLLHVAVNGNSSKIIGILIKAGANPNLKNTSGNTPLVLAERGGHQKAARLLRGATFEAKHKSTSSESVFAGLDYVTTQFFYAVEHGKVEAVKSWIERGADVNKKIWGGGTPLHIAAYKNYPEITTALIEAGAKVDVKDDDSETPLHRAALHDSESVADLIKADADVNARDNRLDSPLHYAAENNAVAAIAALIDAGATIDSVGYGGRTPLFDAIYWKNLEAVKLLLEKGADVNFRINLADSTANGEAPIHMAALYANIEILSALLDAGADPDVSPDKKKKAIDYAIRKRKTDMVKLLIERGAAPPDLVDYSKADDTWAKAERWYKEVKKSDELSNGTETHNVELLCRAVRQGNMESVTHLLCKRRVNVNALDKHGYSPLHWAAVEMNIEIMTALIDKGADLELLTRKGSSPLVLSVWHVFLNGKRATKGIPAGRETTLDAMMFLLDRGANINAVNKVGSTLLHTAASNGEVEMMKVLLDKGADIEWHAHNGWTPLFYAVCSSNLEAVKFLLERGANKNTCDTEHRRTPLHYAGIYRAMKIVNVLLKAGADQTLTDDEGKTAFDYAGEKGYAILSEQPQKPDETTMNADTWFDALRELLYKKFGIILSDQKRSLVVNRLLKKMHAHGCETFEQYYKMIVKDKTDATLIELANQMTTNHTFFFREPVHFDFFKSDILPWMVKKHETQNDNDLRIWCAAAGSGEEPYSIMVTLLEYFGADYKNWCCGLLATDVSEKALAMATSGVYVDGRLHNVPPEILDKYFKKVPDGYAVIDQLKKEVTCRKFNLMNRTLPFKKKFDCIWCRNVMIYFDAPTKHELVNRMYDATVSGGYLLIGHSETFDHKLTKWKYVQTGVYRKEDGIGVEENRAITPQQPKQYRKATCKTA